MIKKSRAKLFAIFGPNCSFAFMIIGIGCVLLTTSIGRNSVMARIMFVISLFVLVDGIAMLIAFHHDTKK